MELYHHGVMGQKWGKRNGPPYPLNAEAHSDRERAFGYKKSIGGGRNEEAYEKNRKKVNKIENKTATKKSSSSGSKVESKEGSVAAAAAVAAIYAAPLVALAVANAIKKGKEHSKTAAIQKKLDEKIASRTTEIDSETGLHKKPKETSVEEDLKEVNPFHDKSSQAVNQNCVLCTATLEMRRRGYDVTANLTEKPLDGMRMYTEMFPGTKPATINSTDFLAKDSNAIELKLDNNKFQNYRNACELAISGNNRDHAKKTISEMSKQPDSRGGMALNWGAGGGHMVAYEVKNGKFKIHDAQIGKTFEGKELEDLLATTVITRYTRLDNCDFDKTKIKGACS